MNRTTHPIEREELMTWLDGELSAERAAEVAAHAKTCEECLALVEEFRRVSAQLAAWLVEPAPASLDARVSDALQQAPQKDVLSSPPSKSRYFFPRWAWQLSAVCALLLLVAAIFIPNLLRSRIAANEASAVGTLRSLNTVCLTFASTYGGFPESLAQLGPGNPPSKDAADLIDSVLAIGTKSGYSFTYTANASDPAGHVVEYTLVARPLAISKSGQRWFFTDQTGVIRSSAEGPADSSSPSIGGSDVGIPDASRGQSTLQSKTELEAGKVGFSPHGPMIVRTASLALVTKEFEKMRTAIQEIVAKHGGFFGQLNVSGEANTGRTLSATVRVPADVLDKVLAELRNLGRVRTESQSGEEVTQQHVDLTARLSNAHATEKRLVEVLQKRTGKVGDVLEVEREIARVRGESERMEAERRALEKRVQFATVQLRVTEDFQAELEVAPPTTSTQLRNAAVEGYKSAVENAIGLAVFFLNAGPTLLLWALIFFWPARLLWRHFRRAAA